MSVPNNELSNSAETGRVGLTRYLLLIVVGVLFMLGTFLLAGALSLALMDDPTPWLADGGIVAGSIGTALLVADVLLPVLASIVMIANGALFGVAGGALLSLIASVGATMLGYAIGRFARPTVLRRLCSDAEISRADRLVRRWGVLAIAVTRPVPLLAETLAIVEGASSLGVGRRLVSATVRSLPGCVLLAAAGAAGSAAPSGVLVFGLVLLLSAGLWFFGRRFRHNRNSA